MKSYLNLTGNSGVISYEIKNESILIKFKDGDTYLYNNKVPGKKHVDEMKRLAEAGKGLATYINKYVRGSFALKL